MNVYQHNLLVALHGKIVKRSSWWKDQVQAPDDHASSVYVAMREVANAIRDLVKEAGVKEAPPLEEAHPVVVEEKDPITIPIPEVSASPPAPKMVRNPKVKKLPEPMKQIIKTSP